MNAVTNSVHLQKVFLIHAAVIIICAALFNALPWLLTGIPLEDQLSWDAKSFVNHWHRLLNPQVFVRDATLSRTLPAMEELFVGLIAQTGQAFGFDMFRWSVGLSVAVLILFLLALYLVSFFTTRNRAFAFLITLAGIIPVKVLGAGKFGLRTLGFVPQYLAFALSLYLVLLYLFADRRQNQLLLLLFFFLCGTLANVYPALFLHMAGAFLFAEGFRRGGFSLRLLTYLASALLGAVPVVIYVLTHFAASTAIDFEIFRERYQYLMLYPPSPRSIYYLRTFLFYTLFLAFLVSYTKRLMTGEERERFFPWISIAKSSFLISFVGLAVETMPPCTKYLFSRTSLWFVLSAMILTPPLLRILFRERRFTRPLFAALTCSALIFLWQSDLIPISIKMKQAYDLRADRKSFLAAVRTLKEMSHRDDRVLAPSGPNSFLAEDVRTYALRSVYVAYQDGGISILDGAKARFWSDRYKKQLELFRDKDPEQLINFLIQEDIEFALLPQGIFQESPVLNKHILATVGNYLIVRRVP